MQPSRSLAITLAVSMCSFCHSVPSASRVATNAASRQYLSDCNKLTVPQYVPLSGKRLPEPENKSRAFLCLHRIFNKWSVVAVAIHAGRAPDEHISCDTGRVRGASDDLKPPPRGAHASVGFDEARPDKSVGCLVPLVLWRIRSSPRDDPAVALDKVHPDGLGR